MTNYRYGFTGRTKKHKGVEVREIFYLGDPLPQGGWIESRANLSEVGNSLVLGNAVVCGNAFVSGDAIVRDDAVVEDSATVSQNAEVSNRAHVCGLASLSGHAHICGDSVIRDSASATDHVIVRGSSVIIDKARLQNSVTLSDCIVSGETKLAGVGWFDSCQAIGKTVIDADARFINCQFCNSSIAN